MKLILVRHGETLENAADIANGQLDGTLSERGLRQIRLLGERLKKEKIDRIYSSSLNRAAETAREIARHHNMDVEHKEALKERNFGIYEGRPFAELQNVCESWGIPQHLFKPENGETITEQRAKVIEFISWLKEEHKDQTVVVVAHGGTNRSVITGLFDIPLDRFFNIKQGNACINVIEFGNDGIILHKLNDTSHLEND